MRAYSSMASSSFSYSSTSSPSYGFQYPNMMMGFGEYDKSANIRYGDSQPSSGFLDTQHFAQPNMTRQLLNLHVEEQETSQQLIGIEQSEFKIKRHTRARFGAQTVTVISKFFSTTLDACSWNCILCFPRIVTSNKVLILQFIHTT